MENENGVTQEVSPNSFIARVNATERMSKSQYRSNLNEQV